MDFNYRRIYFTDRDREWLSRPSKIALFILMLVLLTVGWARGDTTTPALCYPNCTTDQAWVDWTHTPSTAYTYTGDSTTLDLWKADVYGPSLSGLIKISFDWLAYSQNPYDPYDVTRGATNMAAQAWASLTDSAPLSDPIVQRHVNWDPATGSVEATDPGKVSHNPEPASLALLGSGMLLLGFFVRRVHQMARQGL